MKEKIYFIAEIGVNHEANIKLARKIILDAKKGGADAVKLQSYKLKKLPQNMQRLIGTKKKKKKTINLNFIKDLINLRTVITKKL